MSRNNPTDALDELFGVLAHSCRRRILLALSDYTLREEDEFASENSGVEDEAVGSSTAQLYHIHLPKLADMGYIEWDRKRETIRRGPRFAESESLLRLVQNHRDELPPGRL